MKKKNAVSWDLVWLIVYALRTLVPFGFGLIAIFKPSRMIMIPNTMLFNFMMQTKPT